jgi:hypothetical protein
MAFIKAAPASGLLRPRLLPGVGATPWNGFFAPGVLLAALIVVTLTEGLSGLKAGPECRPDRDTEPYLSGRNCDEQRRPFAGACPADRRSRHP